MNDVLVRTIKTFVQAFFGSLAAGIVLISDWNGVKSLVVAAFSAGLAAAWNAIIATS
jgi:hypothetical protein